MFVRNLVSVLSVLVAFGGVSLAQTLTQTAAHTYSHGYAWIDLVGEDVDDDQGGANSSAIAKVVDNHDPNHTTGVGFAEAGISGSVSPAGQSAQGVHLSGYTSVHSYLSAGQWNLGTGQWEAGTVQHFNGSAQAETQVSGNGVLTHFVAIGIDVGSNAADGTIYGWATIGDFRYSFNWIGGSDVEVQVYEAGSLVDWFFTDLSSSGHFSLTEFETQSVSNGDQIPIHAYAVAIDDNNFDEIDKIVTVMAASN